MGDELFTVWLDLTYTLMDRNESVETHLALSKIDPYIVTFRDSDKCIDYINNSKENKFILIITNKTLVFSANNVLLQRFCALPKIDSIYILYSNETNIEHFMETSSNIHQVNKVNLQSFSDQLSQTANFEQCRRRRKETFFRDNFLIIPLTIHSDPLPTDFPVNAASSSAISEYLRRLQLHTCTQEEIDFMSGQLLRRILVKRIS